jgi:site-specific DNA-methyltransferase (adenine-specific)
MPVRQIVIWDRGSGMNFAPTHYVPTHEWIVILAGPDFRLKSSSYGDVWRARPVTGNPHPAPFPQILVDKAIDSTGATSVLDPFCGSGTTLRAAKDAGITGVGIELTAAYCEMTVNCLAQETLFGGMLA